MHKRVVTVITLAVGLLAIVVPILAALYVTHSQAMDEESSRARAMAGEVLRRTDAMGTQAINAYRRLDQAAAEDPCSDASLALMRDLDVASSYLNAVGHIADQRLMCSSFGRHGNGIALGPPAYVSTLGARIRPSVDLGLGPGTRFLVMEKGSYAAAIHPETMLDIFLDRPEISLGVYGRSSRQPMASRGAFDPAWLTKLGDADQKTFFNGRHLVAIRASKSFDIAVYTAIPVPYLRSRLRAFGRVLIPIGLLLGLGLSLALFYLARQQASLPAVLRSALNKQQFVLHYQPIVSLASGRMVGAEALLRWPSPTGSDMRPAVFVQAAEDCGLIQRFTAYVLARVATEAPAFIEQHPDCYISINVSAADLRSERIVEALRTLVDTQGIAARNIIVEVTEHSFLDADRASRILTLIRALGIRVAIDDFGTGYSSLSHLTTLKTDYLKIDKVFVETVGTDSATSEVALHIIRMAQSLGLTLIGEGIETQGQADFLQQHGVQYGQGWLFSDALPMAQLLLRKEPD